MYINLSNLKNEVNKLNNLINKYEEIYLNLYNEFNFSSYLWHDKNSESFFESLKMEKLKIKNNIEEIDDVKQLYDYIINQYEVIGNEIKCNLNSEKNILLKFDSYLAELSKTITYYNNLDLSFCPQFKEMITKEKNIIIREKIEIENVRNKIKKMYKKINEIEREVKLKISKINIEYIKENDMNNFIGDNVE